MSGPALESPLTDTGLMPKPPLHPRLVLIAAVLLPCFGQVLNGTAARAVVMAFFMLSLGVVSWHLTTPAHSFVGRHAGGIFIYAIAVLDAYKWASYRWARFYAKAITARSNAPP